MDDKHLVIGASGLIGSYLCKDLMARNEAKNNLHVVGTYCFNKKEGNFPFVKMDLTDKEGTENLIRAIKPDYIWLCSSFTDVNGCEEDPEKSFEVNVNGPVNVANIAKEIDAKLIFFSSDYIFGGKGYALPDSIPNPMNVYGKHKLLAEHYISTICNKWQIIRTSCVFGVHPDNKNFAARLLQAAKDGESVFKVRQGQIDTPHLRRSLSEIHNRKSILQ